MSNQIKIKDITITFEREGSPNAFNRSSGIIKFRDGNFDSLKVPTWEKWDLEDIEAISHCYALINRVKDLLL